MARKGKGTGRLPTDADLAILPRWALVAFAGRCARRVLPVYDLFARSGTPEETAVRCRYHQGLDGIVSLVEHTAAGWASSFNDAPKAADAAADEAGNAGVYAAAYAANAVDDSASAAAAAAFDGSDDSPLPYAANAAANALVAAASFGAGDIDVAIADDYLCLKAAAERGQWTDETHVPPGLFGTLWPRGEPEGWPRIADKAEPRLPSPEELGSLPRWALLALAARSVRRIQSLSKSALHPSVDHALSLAETAAARGDLQYLRNGKPAEASASAWLVRNEAAHPADPSDTGLAEVALAEAASYVADVAMAIESAPHAVDARANAEIAIAIAASFVKETLLAVAATRRDFALLRSLAVTERWTDDTPVPQEAFGAMWPFGRPAEPPPHREDTGDNYRQEVLLQVEVPEDAGEDEVNALIDKLVLNASALHHHAGGTGLRIDAVEVWAPALVPGEVCS